MQLTYSTDGPVAITLRHARYDFTERRNTWEWTLHDKSGHASDPDTLIASAEDLRDGTGEDAPATDMLRCFLSFLGAWAESINVRGDAWREGENADLFPRKLLDVMDAGEWQEWCERVTMELFDDRDTVHVPAAGGAGSADEYTALIAPEHVPDRI